MDLTTRCPECGASFTASLEQLKLRKGYIRCVECANIFDGFEAVVPEKEAVPASASATLASPSSLPSSSASSTAHAQSSSSAFIASRVRQVPVQASSAAVPGDPWSVDDEPLLWLDDEAEPHELPRREDRFVISSQPASDTASAKAASAAEAAAAIVVEPRRQRGARASSPAFLSERRRGSGIAGFFRWVFVVLLLAVLAGALLYAFRTQVAAEVPQSRPMLEKACQWLGCTVEYPQRIDRIVIMDSSLQAMAGSAASDAGSQVMQLTVVMRNTYDKPQQWPALTLDLVDLAGAVVSRRILQPVDYLDARQLQGPFGAGQEVRLALRVKTDGLRINGFKLGKFFPKKD